MRSPIIAYIVLDEKTQSGRAIFRCKDGHPYTTAEAADRCREIVREYEKPDYNLTVIGLTTDRQIERYCAI